MTRSLLGCHWIRTHPDSRDLPHIEAMQYRSVKLFEWHWRDRNACGELLTVLPKDALILARDHPLSEQKQAMWDDPVGTGTRHANEWAVKVAMGEVHVPVERTFFLGINEPDATSGDRNAIDLYTEAFLRRLKVHGLRGGAFNFSTGHPRTKDGTPNTPADYTVFERSHRAIVDGKHIAVLHIYGTTAVPLAPGHYDRLRACPWQDVTWIVGECGIDEHVIGGGAHDGYLRTFVNPADYCRWLDEFIMGTHDKRIHSYQVFTYDFSHPWDSFDIHPIRDALEAYDWQHVKQQQPSGPTEPPPKPPAGGGAIGYVNAPAGANVRVAPINGSVVIAVPYAAEIRITSVDSKTGWMQVTYAGKTGWMAPQLISMEPPDAPKPTPQPTPTPPLNEQENWKRSIAFVRRWEGGWADHPADPGGATNKGITLATYTRWRQAHGQPAPSKDDLRNLSDEEANRIYYEWYWLESGSEKLAWPLCLAHFDTAVNGGVGRAQEMLQRSGGSFLAYMGHVIDWYTRIGNFEVFGRAWIRRRAEILLEAAK